MSMFRHQKYSIFEILKYVREKSLGNSNIYDMVFSYQNATSKPTINNIPYTLKWHFNGNISETINIHISDLDSVGKFVIYYDYKVKPRVDFFCPHHAGNMFYFSKPKKRKKHIADRDVADYSVSMTNSLFCSKINLFSIYILKGHFKERYIC